MRKFAQEIGYGKGVSRDWFSGLSGPIPGSRYGAGRARPSARSIVDANPLKFVFGPTLFSGLLSVSSISFTVIIIATVLRFNTPTVVPPSISLFGVVESVVDIWVFLISMKCLGEVHPFSAWRAVGAILQGILTMFGMAIGVIAAIWLAVIAARAFL
jgi:hypothetical protein